MRILMITQWFDPEPTFKGLLFAKALQSRGHEVTVVTGFPNYPEGRIYPGYRLKWRHREIVDGVDVIRVPLYPSHDRSSVRRAANYLTFALSASIACMSVKRPDVAYVYHPPATVALPAALLQTLRGVPFVLDVQDLWPDTLAATGMISNDRVLTIVGRLMDRVYQRAAHISVLSVGFRQRLIDRGVVASKVTVVPNWADEEQLTSSLASIPADEGQVMTGRFNVLFAGTIGQAQALDTVLDAAAIMQTDSPHVQFVLVAGGTDVERLQNDSRQRGLANVVFLPRRPYSEIGALLHRADALLVHLKDDPLFAITIPSKTQAYLLMGRPILMGVRGDAAALIKEANAGISFTPQNSQALADAITTVAMMTPDQRLQLGREGHNYYMRELALAVGAGRLASLLERAADSGSWYEPAKRLIDVAASALGIAATAAPAALLAGIVRYRLGSPVLFRQERPGRYGQPFVMYKFRTMTDQRDRNGCLLPDSDRLTPFGRFLRSTSLDELPELINVVKGNMSLVGPRPLLMRYTRFFNEEETRRLNIRPGVTGWAQVNGRNTTSWTNRLVMDVWYVKHLSLKLDIKILSQTFRRVCSRSGLVVDPESIMQNLDDERRHQVSE